MLLKLIIVHLLPFDISKRGVTTQTTTDYTLFRNFTKRNQENQNTKHQAKKPVGSVFRLLKRKGLNDLTYSTTTTNSGRLRFTVATMNSSKGRWFVLEPRQQQQQPRKQNTSNSFIPMGWMQLLLLIFLLFLHSSPCHAFHIKTQRPGSIGKSLVVAKSKIIPSAVLVSKEQESPFLNDTANQLQQLQQQQQLQRSSESDDQTYQTQSPSNKSLLLYSSSPPSSPMVAIVLNTNARSVTPDLIPMAQAIFGPSAVYVTSTVEEAQQAAHDIIASKVPLVIPVGGDGTLSSIIHYMTRAILRHQCQQDHHHHYNNTSNTNNNTTTVDQAIPSLPMIAYIPLGTGNGAGSVVGCYSPTRRPWWKRIIGGKRTRKQELQTVMTLLQSLGQTIQQYSTPSYPYSWLDHWKESPIDVVELPMMELTTSQQQQQQQQQTNMGDVCFFAGVGFDSLMLQDFQQIKEWSKRRNILKESLGSVLGYCVALVSLTLPKCITRQAHQVHVEIATRHASTTYWVDHRRGDVLRPVLLPITNQSQDESVLLYHGTAGIVAAGTLPFYGGGLRLFPFARMTLDKMHLRVGRIHPLRGFVNIPKIFQGSYRDQRKHTFGCLDFLSDDLDITVSSSVPSTTTTTTTTTTGNEQTNTDTNGIEQEKEGYPLQHSGESVGTCKHFRLRVLPHPVQFVTFLPPRVIRDESQNNHHLTTTTQSKEK